MKPLPAAPGQRWLTSTLLNIGNEAQAALGGEWTIASAREQYCWHVADTRPHRSGKPSSPDFVWKQRIKELIELLDAKERAALARRRREGGPLLSYLLPGGEPPYTATPDEALRQEPDDGEKERERERSRRRRANAKQAAIEESLEMAA